MNKELFVSSTPHETKVGLVEDDLLAEIYLERENEYTLAGSIYKGRVTRVLPGMQSAFVDIGLERDAFLYVSDFMELEEHDDDLTDVVPTNRPVPDRAVRNSRESRAPGTPELLRPQTSLRTDQDRLRTAFVEATVKAEVHSAHVGAPMPEQGGDSQNRDAEASRARGGCRGGRRGAPSPGRPRRLRATSVRSRIRTEPQCERSDRARMHAVSSVSSRPARSGIPRYRAAAWLSADPSAGRVDFQVSAAGAAPAQPQ